MEIKQIKELARVMKENDLTALEIHEEGSSIRLERKSGNCRCTGFFPARHGGKSFFSLYPGGS